MPKKKKKGRASRDAAVSNSVDDRGTPSSAQKKHSLPTPLSTSKPSVRSDVISLRLLNRVSGSSSSGKRSIKHSPTILLHESDAGKLDVAVGDRVFVISTADSLPQQIKAVAIARIKVNDGNTDRSSTPRSSLFGAGRNSDKSNHHKKNKLTVGNCHLFPLSLAESFLSSDEDQEFRHDSRAISTPKKSGSNSSTTPRALKETPPIYETSSSTKSKFSFANGGGGDQLIASPSPKQTPASSSKSKFSFAKGGGGDQLISPTASTNSATPTTPSSIRSKSGTNKISIQIVPLDSDLGDMLASIFCRPAKTLYVRRYSVEPRLDNQEQKEQPRSSSPASSWTIGLPLRGHLVVAHTAGEYLTRGALFSVSMQGQTVKCQLDGASHDSISEDDDALVADMERLSIVPNDESVDTAGKHTIKTNDFEESLRSSLSRMSDEKRTTMLLYHVSHETKVEFVTDIGVIDSPKAPLEKADANLPQIIQPKAMVAGLDETIKQVQSALETPLLHPELFKGSINNLKPPKGILLHGPSGIGKSALAEQVGQNFVSNGAYHVKRIHCTSLQSQTAFVGQAEARLVKIFADAQKPRPGKKGCLLILDDVHLICPRREGIDLGADRLVSTLLALLDGMKSSESTASNSFYPTVILAITTNPGTLDAALRRPGRLDSEIEVPLPDEPSTRLKILKFQLESLGTETNFSDSEWLSLARLAKGFTGADLKLAAKDALRNALLINSDERKMTFPLLKKAIISTKPSAIKAVTVEVPSVPWTSIGGMDGVKRQLRDAIELPLTHGATFKRLGIRPPRGVLLYGPPGCSKTLMARALATEGNMNFLAVKGPELLSKWLGESERALAALFRRARLASPAIIFFDEVDAIASKRGGGSSGGGERLLSQLLTELDGIQQSKDSSGREVRVVIVCATNRPDLLDGALMRPGRIDRMIYVGVPDERSRENILKIGLKKSCAKNIDVSNAN
jgi:SpoVK/Ycf46/Vps4 family AAA+-type ATPase